MMQARHMRYTVFYTRITNREHSTTAHSTWFVVLHGMGHKPHTQYVSNASMMVAPMFLAPGNGPSPRSRACALSSFAPHAYFTYLPHCQRPLILRRRTRDKVQYISHMHICLCFGGHSLHMLEWKCTQRIFISASAIELWYWSCF